MQDSAELFAEDLPVLPPLAPPINPHGDSSEGEELRDPFSSETWSALAFETYPPKLFPLVDNYLLCLGRAGRGNHDRLYFTEAKIHAEIYHVLRSQMNGRINPITLVNSEYRGREIQGLLCRSHETTKGVRRYDLGIEIKHSDTDSNHIVAIEIKHIRLKTDLQRKKRLFITDTVRLARSDSGGRYFLLCGSHDKGYEDDWENEIIEIEDNLKKSNYPVAVGDVAIFDVTNILDMVKLTPSHFEEEYVDGIAKVALKCVCIHRGKVISFWLWKVEGLHFDDSLKKENLKTYAFNPDEVDNLYWG